VSEAIRVFMGWPLLQVQVAKSLQQLASQYAGNAEDSRTKQHDAVGLRRRSAAGDGERFRRDRTYINLGGQRRAAARLAADAAVLIPVDRIASGIRRIPQIEPVGRPATEADVQARHRDQINVVIVLIGGKERVGWVLATGLTGAVHRSTVL